MSCGFTEHKAQRRFPISGCLRRKKKVGCLLAWRTPATGEGKTYSKINGNEMRCLSRYRPAECLSRLSSAPCSWEKFLQLAQALALVVENQARNGQSDRAAAIWKDRLGKKKGMVILEKRKS